MMQPTTCDMGHDGQRCCGGRAARLRLFNCHGAPTAGRRLSGRRQSSTRMAAGRSAPRCTSGAPAVLQQRRYESSPPACGETHVRRFSSGSAHIFRTTCMCRSARRQGSGRAATEALPSRVQQPRRSAAPGNLGVPGLRGPRPGAGRAGPGRERTYECVRPIEEQIAESDLGPEATRPLNWLEQVAWSPWNGAGRRGEWRSWRIRWSDGSLYGAVAAMSSPL
jgi:hypothetical protein